MKDEKSGSDIPDDRKLLRHYASESSEKAFDILVRRHLSLVYGVCRRELGEAALAEDAAQVVFLLLARQAASLGRGGSGSIAGWLYTTSRLVCRNLSRQRARRLRYEEAAARAEPSAAATADGDSVYPHLYEALDALRTADREAVLLRFAEEYDYPEIGLLLGISENAARMRVNRALTRMRSRLSARGFPDFAADGGFVLLPGSAGIPADFAASLCQFIRLHTLAGTIQPGLAELYQGAIRTMRLRTLRPLAFAGLAAAVLIGTIGGLGASLHAASSPYRQADPPAAATTTAAEPRMVLIKMRLLEIVRDAAGKSQEHVLQAPILSTTDGIAGKISLNRTDPSGKASSIWSVGVLPHLKDDNKVALEITWRAEEKEHPKEEDSLEGTHTITAKRTLKQGETTRVRISQGDVSAIVLEVSATELKNGSGPGGTP